MPARAFVEADIVRRGRIVLIAAAAVVAVGGAAAAAVGFGGTSEGTQNRGVLPPATAQVTRATLVDTKDVDGELGYGETVPLRVAGAAGTITWLGPIGSTVDRGRPLCRVDNRPVTLLYGALPLYRPLAVGVEGPDVRQFEENIRALVRTGFTVDDTYSESTASAVRVWQRSLGLAETGVVGPGQVVYAAGPIRVAEHKLRVGDGTSGEEVLTYTGPTRVVTIDLRVTEQRLATAGGTVTVTLPDGKAVEGRVASVGTVASTDDDGSERPGGSGGPTVTVVVTVADQGALGSLQQSPVDVRFVASERKDVLTVPVAALLALAEGGYGVEIVEGSTTRIVAVELGMFANGRVEVRGGDLRPGLTVGVPT